MLNLRSFLQEQNHVNQGIYTEWNPKDISPCNWPGISCNINGSRVTGIDLSNNKIARDIFGNFSALTELTSLDLSENSIGGPVPADLGRCQNLRVLNLSQNIIDSELDLTGLNNLEVLDLSHNRIHGEIRLIFPRVCNSLMVVNVSSNSFSGEIGNSFDECQNLEYLDLSSNNLNGDIWYGFQRLREFSISKNNVGGSVPPWLFTKNCS